VARILIRELLAGSVRPTKFHKEIAGLIGIVKDDLVTAISVAREKEQIRDFDTMQIIVSIISLDIFYFLGKPLIQIINPIADIEDFEEKRVDYVVDILINGLRKRQE